MGVGYEPNGVMGVLPSGRVVYSLPVRSDDGGGGEGVR
jgi:hypothetical protein